VTEPVWLLLSRYVRPLAEVDALRADHLAHLERQRAAGHFVLWGRLVPPSGGFVVARGLDRAGVAEVLAEDPFTTGGVARWDVHELALTGGLPALLTVLSGDGGAEPGGPATGASRPGG
jgi:uncharacterized protein YciI